MIRGPHVASCILCFALLGVGPATQPVPIRPTDKAGVDAAVGQDVVCEGLVRSAEWSKSGKVMNIEFVGNEESRLMAVVFQRSRSELDAAFGGDAARAFTESRLQVRATLERYTGDIAWLKGRPQLIITRADQVRVMGQAPATQPAQTAGTR